MSIKSKVVKSANRKPQSTVLVPTTTKQQMQRASKQMADYFNDHISPAALVNWLLISNDYLTQYQKINPGRRVNGVDFLTPFGYGFMAALIESGPKDARLKVLQKEIPLLLNNGSYSLNKELIADISQAFIHYMQLVSMSQESILKCMSMLAHWMVLNEMFGSYEFWSTEHDKELSND